MVINLEGTDQADRSSGQFPMTNGGFDQTLNADLQENLDENGHTRSDVTPTDEEHFGDKVNILKSDQTLRFLFSNINGIPSSVHPKNKAIFKALKFYQADVVGFTETNRCWHLLNQRDRWREISKSWWEHSNNVTSYNTRDINSRQFQPGGTLIHSINKPAHRVLETGIDPSGLGRWCWTRFRGKHDVTTRVICAYRPCKPSSAGPNTAYSQQLRYFDTQSGVEFDICPRAAILEDLKAEIKHCQEVHKDQIILMMDCNQHIQSQTITEWSSSLNLREIMTSSHNSPLPPTYHRGRYPIDGIFVSASIEILACGYLPFGELPSDHRAIWLDISCDNAFGFNIPKVITSAARALKTDDVVVRKKWTSAYEQYLRNHGIHKQIFKLEEKIYGQNNQMHEEDIITYEKILQRRNMGIAIADKNCRKVYLGGVHYSDEYKQVCNEIELWKASRTIKLKAKYSSKKFRRLIKQTNIDVQPLSMTIVEIGIKEKEAMDKYWKLKKNSEEIRQTFLQRKARQAAEEKDIPTATMYNLMVKREAARSSFRKVAYVLGKARGNCILKVDVVTNGIRSSLTSKEAIEEACMAENELKYRQTEGTPCMREPLRTQLGIGTSPACDAILAGTYTPPPNTDEYTIELLKELEYDARATSSLIPHISTGTFISGWKQMKERTSAGISGLHFGHMKACTNSKFLSNVEASISNIPFMTGYSPKPWQTGILVMIQKKAMDDLLSSMRTLVLLEADANFNNKLLGKTTMQQAERFNLIAKEQYGSRKGKCAIHHAVHKRVFYDIIRMQRRPAALCSNDAKSCFDRIIHSIAMLAYRRLGVESPPVESMIRSIQNLKHHVRSGYGDSQFTISSSGTLIPYQGALQGNGAAPTTWVVISTPLLNMLRKAGHGFHSISPISREKSHSVGMAFVDDTDLTQADMRDSTITYQEVMEEMQKAINRWEGGIKATGGAIRPDKSWVYPINFKFDSTGHWQYCSKDDIDFDFTVKDCANQRQPIPQYSPHEAKETLGVFLAPDGNNKEQIRILRLKAEDWKEKIHVGHLERAEAWKSIDYSILQSLRYPLPALTLTKKECTYIMAPILQAGLPASAICRNFPRDVLYGAKDEGGMGKANLYVEQGLDKIEIFKEFIHAKNMTGEFLRTLIEQCKVELGLGGNLFQQDYNRFGHLLTDNWAKSLWCFCSEYNIILREAVTHNLPLTRENDLYLMEIISHSGQFKPAELRHINRCRIHLRVTTLADISTGYGNRYNTLAYQGIRDPTTPKFFLWPRQPRPGPMAISLWRKALRQCFQRDVNGLMEYTLNRWIVPVTTEWKWFYNPASGKLYQRYGNTWRIWARRSQRGVIGQFPIFSLFGNGIHLPLNSSRATVQFQTNRNHLRLTGWKETAFNNGDNPTEPQKFYSGWMLDSTHGTPLAYQCIAADICTGKAKIVSDGSFESSVKMGTAGWVIEDCSKIHQVTGKVHCPGDPTSQCSHRSELIGILGGIMHVNNICKQHGIQSGQIDMGCDGEGAVKAALYTFETIKTVRKHYDIISAIHDAIKASPISWHFFHIDSHQDDIFEYHELSRPEQLNCIADRLAKDKLTMDIQHPPRDSRLQYLPFETSWITWYNRFGQSVTIHSQLKGTLRNLIGRETVRRHWRKKKKFSPLLENNVDWETLHRAHKGLQPQLGVWLSKWLTGFCGIGTTLFLYKFQRHTRCPRCNHPNETVEHVIQCPEMSTRTLWNEEVDKLKVWMEESDFPSEMSTVIYDSLNSWQSNTPFYQSPTDSPQVKAAMLEQDKIGWKSFMDGFQSKKWRTILAAHLAFIRSQRSALRIMAKLMKKLWLLSNMMWKHRNDILHEAGSSIHQYDLQKLNEAIEDEFSRGLGTLPHREYQHLFSGNLQIRLQDTYQSKRMWIASVWTARIKFGAGHTRLHHPEVLIFFDNWRKRIFIPPSDDDEEEDDT